MVEPTQSAVISDLRGSLSKDYYARDVQDDKMIISLQPNFRNRQFREGQRDMLLIT